ncbi:odorant receptor 49b-like isoform X1 [Polyergus mexicanus]|uniref:odorant receptor 49b-like isoform X1 n=2 Tax=Polyergus mexicanus TaxID=615972 RepID=UPI0038B6700E
MCFSTSKEMISIKDRYFSLNRTLLLAIGLWPYEKSTLARFRSICFFSIEATFIIPQLITFVNSKFTLDIIIKILSPTFACISFALTYNSFYINGETVMYLMEQLQNVYDNIKDNNEFVIMEKYGNNAKRYTIVLIILFFVSASVHISAEIWPAFSDVILSFKSRPHHINITTDYFVKREQYFWLRQLHINVAIYIGIVAVIATGAMLIACIQYICGMFKIASYRIENAMQIYISQDINLQKKSSVQKNIISAVDMHRKAMKFLDRFISKFEISFMLLIIFGVITLSFNIFRMFQVVLSGYNIEQFLLSVLIILVCILYMFLSNFVGQEIIDHNNVIYTTAYNARWYTAPLHIQKLILFLLQRGSKTFGLNVGGLFVASLECFATLVKASVSYFTVMYSVQ